MKRLVILGCFAVAAASANATIWGFSAPILDGAQEVPPTGSAAYGTASYNIDDSTWIISGSVTITGLSLTEVTGLHIHNAPMGVNGPIIFDVLANLGGTNQVGNVSNWFFTGILDDTPILRQQKLSEMIAGNAYFNAHTAANPDGEIRGQIICTTIPEPATIAVLGIGLASLLLLRRRR